MPYATVQRYDVDDHDPHEPILRDGLGLLGALAALGHLQPHLLHIFKNLRDNSL